MARLETEVTANIGPFEKALKTATEKAREFAEKAKDVTADIGKETGGGGLVKMLGLAGGAAAATAFGTAIVETVKRGLDAFSEMEQRTIRLKANFGEAGKELDEWAEKMETAGISRESIERTLVSLKEGGFDLETNKSLTQALMAEQIKTGTPMEEMGEAMRKAAAGGLDAGEGVNRLIKGFPSLAGYIEAQTTGQAAAFRRGRINSGQLMSPADEEEFNKLRNQTPADFAKSGALDRKELTNLILGNADLSVLDKERQSQAGTEAELGKTWNHVLETVGEAMSAPYKQALNQFIAELPKIAPYMVTLEKGLLSLTLATVKATEALFGMVEKTGFHLGEETYKAVYNMVNGPNAYEHLTQNPGKYYSGQGGPEEIHRGIQDTNKLLNELVDGLIRGGG